MATVERAEELLEKLRSASWNPAVKGYHFFLLLLPAGIFPSVFFPFSVVPIIYAIP